MSQENMVKFTELLAEDKNLVARLRAAEEALDDSVDDEAAKFEATLGKVASEVGLPFTLEEARASMIVERELDDAELEAISGGRGACYYIGFTTEPEIECGNGDGHICAYGGIGIPG